MSNGQVNSVSRVGQINATGDANALFLKVFSNEILTTFEESNVMKDLHTVRTISSGKEAQFPVIGSAEAKYFSVGEDVLESSNGYAQQIKHGERTISIDDMLIAATFVANIDELKSHFDVRSTYSAELGRALAKRFDLATMKTLVAAAETAADGAFTGAKGGITVDLSDNSISGSSAAADIIKIIGVAAQKMDENDVPSEDRFVILDPSRYYELVTTDNIAINTDTAAGNGSVATGKIAELAGITIVKSNHLASVAGTDLSATSGAGSDNHTGITNNVHGGTSGYDKDFSAVLPILGGHKAAIGTVKLLDLAVEQEYIMTKQGTAMLAKYAVGHGVLRPEASFCVKA
jgi:hypothetical protein